MLNSLNFVGRFRGVLFHTFRGSAVTGHFYFILRN
jgi:hypothetical protein